MDYSNLSREEKLELLNQAKDAYYNTGEEILTDYEYDELEKELGLENNNYVGSKAGNYNVKHSFIMGSLSKVQIHKDKETGIIDWEKYAAEIDSYFKKAKNCRYIETTPKLDGCSFRVEFTVRNNSAKLISCATRGNGEYGSDISSIFKQYMETSSYWQDIDECCDNILSPGDILCISGEVLIPYSDFNAKYANITSDKKKQYANPRSFVSGQLGADDDKAITEDLHFVCYDYRIIEKSTRKYYELSWMNPNDKTYAILKPYLNHIGELPDSKYCNVYTYDGKLEPESLQEIYAEYADFRENNSEYALDGIVFKPECSARQYNIDRPRPVDCVAMKFIPMTNETEIIDIIWEAKKSGEYKPIGIVKPIYLDSKKIQKVSLHNYNDIIKKGCGIGSIVEISLAGDIIPHVLHVIKPAGAENINLPDDAEIIQASSGNYKLMKVFTDDNDQDKAKFMTSAEELKINNVGPAAANKLWEVLHNDIGNLDNILDIMSDDVYDLIYSYLGKVRSVSNIVESLKQYAEYITIYDIIRSCCIPGCRDKSAKVCEKIILGLPYNTTSINRAAYQWALDPNNPYYIKVMDYINKFGILLDDKAAEETEIIVNNDTKIPIVMTGSPKEFGFKTKADFLAAHPEYVDVGSSIKDCKILFTDDLKSTSSKMKQAAKYGVEVRLYESFYF